MLGGSTGETCRNFALKTLDRMLKEVWSESRGFGHRIGGPALDGSLDDQVFSVLALLDAYEATLEPRYFAAAQKTMDLAIARYGDAEGGGFFDRPSDAVPMGGLDVRRKPFQDSPTPGANSVAAIALIRMHAFTGDERYHDFAKKTSKLSRGSRRSMECLPRRMDLPPRFSRAIRCRSSSPDVRMIPPRRLSKPPLTVSIDSENPSCG